MPTAEYLIYISRSSDPYLNLAIENWIYQDLPSKRCVLFLSRNRKSVVIGRFQNPWLECKVENLLKDNVPLLRRQSGGGTVYHDFGNTNYSFIVPAELYNLDAHYRVIMKALQQFGITAERTERNDLYLAGKKFSGSAFKKSARKVIHHGTLLHHGDTRQLYGYLSGTAVFSDAKGIPSVPAPVINLSEACPLIDHEALIGAVAGEYRLAAETGGYLPEAGRFTGSLDISEDEALRIDTVRAAYHEYRGWEWIFGKTPPFTQLGSWENGPYRVMTTLQTRHCIIEKIQLEAGPGEHPVPADFAEYRELSEQLQGVPYRRSAVSEKLAELYGGREVPLLFGPYAEWLCSRIYPS
jgi:lipoate---protein ligase